jgi:hypothetical protein
MTKEFIPNINRNVFANTILEIQDYEGNDWTVVKIIKSKIESYKGFSIYDAFMYTCNEYKIDFKCYEVSDGNLSSFKIIIRLNSHDNYSLLYQDRDVTNDLAHKLYTVLGVEVTNEAFVNSIKK